LPVAAAAAAENRLLDLVALAVALVDFVQRLPQQAAAEV
jgi:hypothetical protein